MIENFIVPLVAVVRGACGWAENAFVDGTVTWPEWRQLGQTVMRIGVPGFALVYGFQMDEVQAASIAVLGDFLLVKGYHVWQELKEKKK